MTTWPVVLCINLVLPCPIIQWKKKRIMWNCEWNENIPRVSYLSLAFFCVSGELSVLRSNIWARVCKRHHHHSHHSPHSSISKKIETLAFLIRAHFPQRRLLTFLAGKTPTRVAGDLTPWTLTRGPPEFTLPRASLLFMLLGCTMVLQLSSLSSASAFQCLIYFVSVFGS